MTWVEEWLHVSKYLYHIYVQPNFKHVLTDRQLLPLRSRTEKCYVLHRSRISMVFPITRQSGHKAVTDKARSGNLCYITNEVKEASSKKIVPPPIPFFGAHYYYETCAIHFRCVPTMIENNKSASFRLHPIWGQSSEDPVMTIAEVLPLLPSRTIGNVGVNTGARQPSLQIA